MDSIANLSQYRENGPIKARVIWKKAKGYWPTEGFGGNLFNLDLMDATGKIHVTAYQDECEKFYDLIEIGNVYIFSGYCVKMVDIGGFYWPHKHPFEIKLNSTTEVKLCEDNDDEGIPEIKLDLLPICQVWYKGSNEFVDTVGFCTKVGEMAEAYTPTGTKAIRDITLADPMSGDSVTLTLWNNEAKHLDGQVGSLILVRGSRINIWNGVTKLNGGSVLKINVNTPEVQNMSDCFDNCAGRIFTLSLGKLNSFQSKNEKYKNQQLRSIEKVKSESNGILCEKWNDNNNSLTWNDIYNSLTCHSCRSQLWRIWLGYINPVEDESIEDKYRCSYCKYSLLVNMVIGNWTSNRWVTCFNDAGKQLLKHAVKFHPELEVVGTAQVKHE